NNAHELILLDQAGQALAEARSLEEIKTIRDKAEAVRKYAQSASLGLDVQNRAAEVKLRAERQAGKLLSQMMLRGGDRRSKGHRDRLKLGDLGLTPNQSKRWQLQARVPENLFREHIRQTCQEGKELTSAGLMRLAKRVTGRLSSNGHSNGKSGHSINADDLNGKFNHSATRLTNVDESSSIGEFGEIVSELRNHQRVLDGILRPHYSGESSSFLPAELRILRYLMVETSRLLAHLQQISTATAGCGCHADRFVG
ncbi:MAG TPA: hypothetical protein VHK01_01285, partial [Lacipirellulaceae bacterium]|nr:hypothetical protein [Lacipirellulaceae bacterium]